MNPATLYTGQVSHIRHTPLPSRFKYNVWMLCIDLDELDTLAARSKIFSHNRFGLVALHDKDHGFRDGSSLTGYARTALADAGLARYGATIRFIAMPRVLGYGFSPISFYFCYDAQGLLGAVLHQVKNTFGDQIGYVMPVAPDVSTIRQSAPKSMHVSPFFDVQGGYRFVLSPPGEKFSVSIQYGAEVKRLTATMRLQGIAFSDAALRRLLWQMPFASLKVVAAIHWQAFRLFLRGAKFFSEPQRTHPPIVTGQAE